MSHLGQNQPKIMHLAQNQPKIMYSGQNEPKRMKIERGLIYVRVVDIECPLVHYFNSKSQIRKKR